MCPSVPLMLYLMSNIGVTFNSGLGVAQGLWK